MVNHSSLCRERQVREFENPQFSIESLETCRVLNMDSEPIIEGSETFHFPLQNGEVMQVQMKVVAREGVSQEETMPSEESLLLAISTLHQMIDHEYR